MKTMELQAKSERIAKVIARSGLCSRREAERWIEDRRVKVNGKIIDSPALAVSETDAIAVDGSPLPDRPYSRVWRYHKPPGLVTTHADPQKRPTVFPAHPHGTGTGHLGGPARSRFGRSAFAHQRRRTGRPHGAAGERLDPAL